ncbi:hypothetical protein [Amycolatopsis sp. NPDC051371]|uniref:hypothetical protein n=1 Tax=Amycolatopsis sp. NPDC051371 TaxID=3155800 RepID=UPI00344241FD
MNARLRPPGPPIRVAELLLPTVLTLAGRGPVSAENFLAVLAGTRVTAGRNRTKAVKP